MSEAETSRHDRSPPRTVAERLRRLSTALVAVLRAMAFWVAVVLPAVYLPLLFADDAWTTPVVSRLLAAHVLSVLVGKEYHPDR